MFKHAFMYRFFILAMFLIILFTQSGCGPSQYILVQSSAVETIKDENMAEVTKTPRYSEMVSLIKSVALKAPTSCENKSASEATGTAEANGAVVKTVCGVEMAEIERALVRQGFTVYSWNTVSHAITENKITSATEAAKRLGAQVLFQINSLERVKIAPSRDVRVERNFFVSNKYGDTMSPLNLDENRINQIKQEIATIELNELLSAKKLGSMLDITAIDSGTAQTIWFYRSTSTEDTSTIARFLIKCNERGCSQEDIENRDDEKDNSPNKRSKEVETFSIDSRPASEQDAIYFKLLRKVTAGFVKLFSSGQ